jgi:hypothetical protein
VAAQVWICVDERFLVPLHYLLEHLGRGHARLIRAACGRPQRQSEADEIVRGITNYRLIEIANLDIDRAVGIGYGTQISDMAIPACPNRRALRYLAAIGGRQAIRRTFAYFLGHKHAQSRPSSGSGIGEAQKLARKMT